MTRGTCLTFFSQWDCASATDQKAWRRGEAQTSRATQDLYPAQLTATRSKVPSMASVAVDIPAHDVRSRVERPSSRGADEDTLAAASLNLGLQPGVSLDVGLVDTSNPAQLDKLHTFRITGPANSVAFIRSHVKRINVDEEVAIEGFMSPQQARPGPSTRA